MGSGRIKTNDGHRCSYGQAQKAINVFLKLYVDWARRPNPKVANKILPFLHAPLDSILMGAIWEKYPNFYENDIRNVQKEYNANLSLSKIGRNEYSKWQSFFRNRYSLKPLLFDIAWAINR